METRVFSYRHKLFPSVVVLVVFLAIPAAFQRESLRASIPYWSVFGALQLVVQGYFAAKRIVVSEQGIETRFLGMRLLLVPWGAVQELNVVSTASANEVGVGGLRDFTAPLLGLHAWARRRAVTRIRLTVTGIDPVVFLAGEIRNGAELGKLLRERIPVV